MSFRIENPVVEADNVGGTKDEIEILERLGGPETLHAVALGTGDLGHVVEGCAAVLGARAAFDGFKHGPGGSSQCGVPSYAVENEDGFDCFGSTCVVRRNVKKNGVDRARVQYRRT